MSLMESPKETEIRIIGRCKLDTKAILTELPGMIFREMHDSSNSFWQMHYNSVYMLLSKEDRAVYSAAYERTFSKHYNKWPLINHGTEQDLENITDSFTEAFSLDIDAAEAMKTSFKCYLDRDDVVLVSLSGSKDAFWLLPSKYVDIEEYTDYSALTGSQRQSLLGEANGNTGLVSSGDLSYNDVLVRTSDVRSAVLTVESAMQDVRDSKAEGLKDLQAEIDRLTNELEQKKRSMLDELEIRKSKMEAELEKMENAVFRLDSEIYNIRCYTGEVVEINQLRTGRAGRIDSPIVFYQKMRYLDEELGKIASLYGVDFSDAKYFESILINRDDVRDAFLPAERSIVLVRVSKTNKGYYNTEFPGILETYEKYHGRKVAILIRDGENLYLTWTDDDRIYFSEDAFLKPMSRVAEESEAAALMKDKYESDKDYEKRIKDLQKTAVKESLGRYYVFTLLQGMLDRGLIKLPEKVKLTDSKYVIFSMADGWLDDNRYGTFGEMIERCNASVKKGDHILMTSSLWANSKGHKNDRGRGYADRTWDVRAKDIEVYPINLTEHIAQYSYTYTSDEGPETNNTGWRISDEEYRQKFVESYYADRYTNIKMVPGSEGSKYYVSLLKSNSWTGKARANFEVYKDEFINLTFMNSVWLKYVLINNKSGVVRIGRCSVDFAHVIPYIKKALEFVENREEETFSQILKIDPSIAKDKEWPVKLSEWMLKNDIHNFSEYRTKQFVKSIKESEKC